MNTLSDARMKRTGTREEVFKGLATRTAGGLKRDDIIPKQFGTKTLYISKRLSDRMRDNFNVIRANNPNYFKRHAKKTLHNASKPIPGDPTPATAPINAPTPEDQANRLNKPIKPHGKTQKLSFKIHDNTVKNVYYKELRGIDLQELKEELKREEAVEDLGTPSAEPAPIREFSIEEMPNISLADLE